MLGLLRILVTQATILPIGQIDGNTSDSAGDGECDERI